MASTAGNVVEAAATRLHVRRHIAVTAQTLSALDFAKGDGKGQEIYGAS